MAQPRHMYVWCVFILTFLLFVGMWMNTYYTATEIHTMGDLNKGSLKSSKYESRTYSTLIDLGNLSIKYVGKYAYIYVEHTTRNLTIPGNPILPYATINIPLPLNTIVKTVNIMESNKKILHLRVPIAPCPRPGIPSQNIPPEDIINKEIYLSSQPYPKDTFEYKLTTGLNSSTCDREKVLRIYIYPVRYIPSSNTVIYSRSLSVTIRYVIRPMNLETKSRESYDMVIISPDSFVPIFNSYASWRTNMGIETKVVSLNDIYGGTYTPPQGRDNAEKIKYFIKWGIETWNIKYVLLGGDVDVMPVRYVDVPDGFDDNNEYYIDGRVVPTDLYFADIYDGSNNFVSWDSNNNNVFGEWQTTDSYGGGYLVDSVDLHPDVYIGRIVASTSSELSGILNKIMSYYDTIDEAGWFNNVVLCGTDTFDYSQGDYSGVAEGEYMCDYIYQTYLSNLNPIKCYASLNTATSTDITNAINNGARFIAFSDHGQYLGWGYDSATSQDAIYTSYDVAALGNQGMYAFVTVDACLTGGFDNEDPNNPYSNSDSFAEQFLINPNGGGIGVFAASRVGFGDWGTNYALHYSGYHVSTVYQGYAQGLKAMGDMWGFAKESYLNDIGIGSVMDYKTIVEYNLLGDPSISIEVGGLKIDYSTTTISLKPGETESITVTVNNNKALQDTVTFSVENVPSGWQITITPSALTLPSYSSSTTTISITAPDQILADTSEDITINAIDSSGKHYYNTIHTLIEQYVDFDFDISLDTATTDPGQTQRFDINIDYIGNIQDTLEITIQKPDNTWDVSINSIHASSITMPVQPYSSTGIIIDLTPSLQTVADLYPIQVDMVSQRDPTVKKVCTLYITVAPYYSVALDTSSLEHIGIINPGVTVNSKIEVQNEGNSKDTFELSYTILPNFNPYFDDYNADECIDVSFSYNEVTTNPFETSEIVVAITPTSKALAGDYTLTIFVRSKNDINIADQESTIISIGESYGFNIKNSEEPLMAKAMPSKEALINITVDNLANTYDTLIISTEFNGDINCTVIYPTSVDIPPFSMTNITVTFVVPDNQRAGEYTGTFTLQSMGNDEFVQYIDFVLVVLPVANIALEITSNTIPVENESIVDMDYWIGETKSFDIYVYNTGNIENILNIHVIGLEDTVDYWDTIISNEMYGDHEAAMGLVDIPLGFEDEKEFTFSIVNIGIPPAGQHPITIEIKHDGGTLRYIIYINVLEFIDINVTSLEWNDEPIDNSTTVTIEEGKSGNFEIEIKNTGNCNVTLYLEFEGSCVNNIKDRESIGQITLEPGESGRFTITLVGDKSGDLKIMPRTDRGDVNKYALINLKLQAKESSIMGSDIPMGNPFTSKKDGNNDIIFLVVIVIIITIILVLTSAYIIKRKQSESTKVKVPLPIESAQTSKEHVYSHLSKVNLQQPQPTYTASESTAAYYMLPYHNAEQYTPTPRTMYQHAALYINAGYDQTYSTTVPTPIYSTEKFNQNHQLDHVQTNVSGVKKEEEEDIESWFDDL